MAELYSILKQESKYFDKSYGTQEAYNNALRQSSTVYVGNLSFFTTQDSLRELFSRAGNIDRIIMGINNEGSPCGFCFVIYTTHEEAERAVEYISKSKLDERVIRVDWDAGYKEGREKGRGTGGQQKRDDFRNQNDADRPNQRKRRFERREDRGGYHDRRDDRGYERRDDRGYDRRDDRGYNQNRERYQRDRGDREYEDYGKHSRPYKRRENNKNSDDEY